MCYFGWVGRGIKNAFFHEFVLNFAKRGKPAVCGLPQCKQVLPAYRQNRDGKKQSGVSEILVNEHIVHVSTTTIMMTPQANFSTPSKNHKVDKFIFGLSHKPALAFRIVKMPSMAIMGPKATAIGMKCNPTTRSTLKMMVRSPR